MNRIDIKNEAKQKIEDNRWDIWWPLIVIMVLSTSISNLLGSSSYVINGVKISIGSSIVSLLTGIVMAGYMKYLLDFVRNGKFNYNAIIQVVKEKWLNILIAEILTTVIIALFTMLLIVPGIIVSLSYAFVILLVIDTDIAGHDSLKACQDMMDGYKWDYFVFLLSFIGWGILCCLTCGILLVWVLPYFMISKIIYYDELKKLRKIK